MRGANASRNQHALVFMTARSLHHGYALGIALCAIIISSAVLRAQNWTKLSIPATSPTPDLYCVGFFSADTGFVGGTAGATPVGKLYYTDNGGAAWQAVALPGAPKTINDIHFIAGTSFGVIVGDGGYVAVTANRGATWALTAASPNSVWPGGGDIQGVYFKDPNNGWVVGKAPGAGNGALMARTANGGATWVNIAMTGSANNLYDIDFFEPLPNLIHGVVVGTGNPPRKSVSTNSGTTWEANANMGLPQGASLSFYGVDAVDGTSTAYAAGGQVVPGPAFYGEVRKSTDFGVTWQQTAMAGATSPAAQALNGVQTIDASTLFVSGRGARAFRSTDGGVTWSAEALPTGPSPGGIGTNDLYRFSRTPTDHLFLVGRGGVVLRYTIGANVTFSTTQLTFDKSCPTDVKILPITLGNTGGSALTVDSVRITQPALPGVTFSVAARPGSIAPGATGTLSFKATMAANAQPGLYTGTALVFNNDESYTGSDRQKLITLTVSVTTKTLQTNAAINGNVGTFRIGPAFSKLVTINDVVTNTGECDINLFAHLARGTDFTLTAPALANLSSGQHGSIVLTFAPTLPCERYDTVIIEHDAVSPASPIRIPIMGIGLVPTFKTTPADTLDFTGIPVGTAATRDLLLENNLYRALCLDTSNIFSFTITGPNASEFTTTFTMPGSGRLPLGPLQEVAVPITAQPVGAGQRIAYAVIATDVGGATPDTVVLAMNGLKPELNTTNSEIRFPLTDMGGQRDSVLTNFLFNLSNANAKVLSAQITGINSTDFIYNAPPPSFDVPSGGKRTIEVTFKPTNIGARTAALELVTDISPTPIRIGLFGNATRPKGGYLSGLVLFNATSVNDCRDTTLKRFIYNSGIVPLRITSASILPDPAGSPGDEQAFTLLDPVVPPELTIKPGDSIPITLRFCPKAPHLYYARLVLGNNVDTIPFDIQLIGSGRSSRVIAIDTVRFRATRVLAVRDTVIDHFIFNKETGPLVIDSIAITGADRQSFTLLAPMPPFAIPGGRDTAVSIRFNPYRRDRHAAFLDVYTSQGMTRVVLIGPAIYPQLAVEPDNPASLRVRIGSSRRLRINTINIGDDSAHVENVQLNGSPEYTNVTVDPLPATLKPGDTVRMFVDFTPAHFCNADVDIRIRGEGIRGIYAIADTSVRFAGIGSGPLVGTRAPEINFGIRQVGAAVDSTLNDFLGNTDFTGSIASSCLDSTHIDSMAITGPGSGAFTLTAPSSPLIPQPLGAGTVQPLSIHFQSSTAGLKLADLLVYFDGEKDSMLRIPLIGVNSTLPIEYGPAKNMFQIDFGNLRVGTRRDSIFTAVNISKDAIAIDALASTLPDELEIISPTGSFQMQPGVPIPVHVAFTPRSPLGRRVAYTKFTSGSNIDSSFRLVANVVDEALRLGPPLVDFGLHAAGTQSDTSALLLNEITTAIPEASMLDSVTVDTAMIISGNTWFALLSFPHSIRAEGRDSIMLRFLAAGATGRRDGIARILYDRRIVAGVTEFDTLELPLTGRVKGEGIPFDANLGAGRTGSPGDTVRFPIVLSGDFERAQFDTLDVMIGFRKTMLKPIEVVTASQGVSATLDPGADLKSTHGSARVRIASAAPLQAGTIAEVAFMVLLGDSMECVLGYDSIGAFERPDIFFRTDSVRFAINEFCDASGRLIRFDSVLTFASKPNPATRLTSFSYTLPAIVHTQLSIYDASGSEVARIVDGMRNPGYYIVPFDASALASGTYYCVLTAGRFTRTLTLQLVE
jgi:photosystem II stability/assembly factor-like uncharacterized protein